MAAALIVPVGVAVTSSTAGAVIDTHSAACTGTSGTATFDAATHPRYGLLYTVRAVHTLGISNVGETCTGGTVNAGTLSGSVRTSRKFNCKDLQTQLGNITWQGHFTAKWTNPAGLGLTAMNVNAHVSKSTVSSTTFSFSGFTQTAVAKGPFAGGKVVKGHVTINKSLFSKASGGDCTVTIPILGGNVIGSALNIKP